MKEFVCDFPNFDSCNAAKYSVIDSTVASGVLWENQNERKEVASELSLTTRLPQNQFPDLEGRRFFKGRVEYFTVRIYFQTYWLKDFLKSNIQISSDSRYWRESICFMICFQIKNLKKNFEKTQLSRVGKITNAVVNKRSYLFPHFWHIFKRRSAEYFHQTIQRSQKNLIN